MRLFPNRNLISWFVKNHFPGVKPQDLVTAARGFPVAARVDLQCALDQVFSKRAGTQLVGVHSSFCPETITFSHLFAEHHLPIYAGPLQHDEVDIGDSTPVRCLKNGLWLSWEDQLPFALLLGSSMSIRLKEHH